MKNNGASVTQNDVIFKVYTTKSVALRFVNTMLVKNI